MDINHWDAVVSLLRLDYPCITRAKLQAMLGGGRGKVLYSRQDIRRMLSGDA